MRIHTEYAMQHNADLVYIASSQLINQIRILGLQYLSLRRAGNYLRVPSKALAQYTRRQETVSPNYRWQSVSLHLQNLYAIIHLLWIWLFMRERNKTYHVILIKWPRTPLTRKAKANAQLRVFRSKMHNFLDCINNRNRHMQWLRQTVGFLGRGLAGQRRSCRDEDVGELGCTRGGGVVSG